MKCNTSLLTLLCKEHRSLKWHSSLNELGVSHLAGYFCLINLDILAMSVCPCVCKWVYINDHKLDIKKISAVDYRSGIDINSFIPCYKAWI